MPFFLCQVLNVVYIRSALDGHVLSRIGDKDLVVQHKLPGHSHFYAGFVKCNS